MRFLRFLLGLAVALLLALLPAPLHAQDSASTQGAVTLSATGCVPLNVLGMGTAAFDVTITGTATVTFYTEGRNGTRNLLNVAKADAPSTTVTTTTASGVWSGTVAGYNLALACVTSYTSGSISIAISASPGGGGGGGGGTSSSVSITQGGNTAQVNASSQLSVTCANCSGSGVSANEDSAGADGMATTPASARRQDSLTGDTSADGDVAVLKSDSVGRLYVTGTGGTFNMTGAAATDAAVSGNPVYVAGKASAAAPSDVSADGDVVPFWQLRSGALATQPTFAGVLAVAGNGASGTGVQRVTVANDSTGILAGVTTVSTVTTLSQFGGNAINLGAGAVGTGTLRITEASDAPQTTALQLIDNPVGSASGGSAGTSSFLGGGIYNSTPPTLTNGQQAGLQLTSAGALIVSGSAGATQYNEDAAAGDGNATFPIACVRRDTTPSVGSGAAGDYSWCNVDGNGRLYTNTTLYDASGNALTPATDKTEDSAEAGGETGPLMLAVRRDTAASSSGTAGDFSTINVDALGRLWTRRGDPCGDHARIQSVAIDTATSGNVELVALNSGDIVYVCGYDMVADGAVAVQFIYGTGTACATGETDLSGPMSFAANGGISRAVNGAVQFKNAVSNALCIENSTTGGIRGHLEYVRTAAP